MSAIRTRRLRVSRRKKRCSQCKEAAQRFKDIGPTRVWFCATHFKENENGSSNEERTGS
jgi:hypothetical protein